MEHISSSLAFARRVALGVYLLRWMAAKLAGLDFIPLFTITAP
jgi:hypothetical protein